MPANLAEESLVSEHPFGMVAPSFVEKELPQIGIDHRSVYIYIYILGGGFKYFHPYLGKILILTDIFQIYRLKPPTSVYIYIQE